MQLIKDPQDIDEAVEYVVNYKDTTVMCTRSSQQIQLMKKWNNSGKKDKKRKAKTNRPGQTIISALTLLSNCSIILLQL